METYKHNDILIDEESEYILSVINDCKAKGLTTNVDFVKAEEERKTIEAHKHIFNVVEEVKSNSIVENYESSNVSETIKPRAKRVVRAPKITSKKDTEMVK